MRFRRRKAVPVAGRAAAGVLCLVHCLFIPYSGYLLTGKNIPECTVYCRGTEVKTYEDETRHPAHRRYRWRSELLKGAVAGASPAGPWTDGRTGVRIPDHDERQPRRIPLDHPCLLPTVALSSLIP